MQSNLEQSSTGKAAFAPRRSYRRFGLWVALVLVGALVLLWTPLLNGYPILHADSGTYLWSSVIFLVPSDRPIGYGLFIRAASLAPSVWAVVVVQALGTSYLMLRVAAKVIAPAAARPWLALAVLVATALTTSVSTFVGLIVPDIFVSWLFLGGALVLLSSSRADRTLGALAVVVAVVTHNSHIALALGAEVVLLGLALVLPRWRSEKRDALILLAAALGIALAGMVGINLYLRAGVALTRGGDTIWINRLAELRVLSKTLDRYCDEEQWTLCAYRDLVSQHDGEWRWFLFGADSPIAVSGWDKHADEQRAILLHALQCCAEEIVESSAQETWRQAWLLPMDGYLVPLADSMNAVLAVRKNYPGELAAFEVSGQQQSHAPPTLLVPVAPEWLQVVFLLAAAVVGFWSWRVREWRVLGLLAAACLLVALNALVMATFSGAVPRYQARAAWLVPYAVFVGIAALGSRRQMTDNR